MVLFSSTIGAPYQYNVLDAVRVNGGGGGRKKDEAAGSVMGGLAYKAYLEGVSLAVKQISN